MLEISTNNLSSRKKIKIDGHVYTVRKLGAGEEMDINSIIRELNKISKRNKGKKDLSPADEAEFNRLQERSLAIYAGTFDDGGDGSKALALIKGLSYEDRGELHKQIFALDVKKTEDNPPEDNPDEQVEQPAESQPETPPNGQDSKTS